MKTEWLKVRASQEDLEALQSVAETLVLERSTALWFLVHEKRRALGKDSSSPPVARSKKRRAAGA